MFDITYQSGRGFDGGAPRGGAPTRAAPHCRYTAAGTWAQSTVAQTGEDVDLLGDAIYLSFTFERWGVGES